MIGLINYGSGNLRSVSKALEKVGAQVELVDSPEGLDALQAVVVPGVGAFGDCVRNLREHRLWEPLRKWLADDRPYFGICLGYQMLFESSEESPGVEGFGVFEGPVVRFKECGLKIPHMGWNTVRLTQPSQPAWIGLPSEPSVFFVHSYYPAPKDPSIVSGVTEYGGPFAASVGTRNIVATQFHPEKSQHLGLAILRNWVASLS